MADNSSNLQPQLSLGHEIHGDDPLQIWDTNIISHHILHAIEPFEAFHPLMSKANDLVQAFRDRQEILAQAPHGEFPTW